MSRSPDPDPPRGPRRYGPTSNDPAAARPRSAWSDIVEPTAVHPPYQQPSIPEPSYQPSYQPSYRSPDPRQPDQQPGYRQPDPYQQPSDRSPRPDRARPGARVAPPPPVRPAQRPLAAPAPDPWPAGTTGRRTPGFILAGRIVAAVLSVAVLAGFAFAWSFVSNASDRVTTGNSADKAGSAGVLFRGGTNILLIGSDARTDQQGNPLTAAELAAVSTQDDGGGVNTDTIMVVHIPEGGGKATAVSIPRDTYIPQSVTDLVKGPDSDGGTTTYKPGKINGFYASAKFYTQEYLVGKGVKDAAQRERDSNNAGRTELQAIIQAFTGLHIDHYAEVNLIGFYTLSKAIGGVPVCLNKAVDDRFSGAHFKAGPQEISGSAAMAFVRQRHGLPGGDLDRVRRQQAFLAGATSKMLSAGVLTSPSKLGSLVDAAGRAVILDSGFNLLSFAEQMANLSGGNVTFTTIPTHGRETAATVDALHTDPAEIKAFFSALDGRAATGTRSSTAAATSSAVSPSSITVDVLNATRINNLAASVSATLTSAGFKAGNVVSYPGITAETAHATTTISYPAGARSAAAAVQKALGGKGKLVADDSLAAGHISVAAGKDMPAPSGLRAPLVAAAATTTPATQPTTITAATVGCVN